MQFAVRTAMLAFVSIGGTYVAACHTLSEAPAVAESTPVADAEHEALLARGTYLAHHVTLCADCHAERDWSRFSAPVRPETIGRGGDRFGPEMGLPGTFWSRNITPAGVGSWSDEEVTRAFTTGVTPDGRTLFPIMPYQHYAHLCDDDVRALLTWVRSLEPAEGTVPDRELLIPEEVVASMAVPRDPWECPTDDRVERGRYLTMVGVCEHCHTPLTAEGTPGPSFSGGFPFPLPSGGTATTANLTPDVETGIGSWSEDAFVARFRSRQQPYDVKHGEFNTIMPWTLYAGMTDEDLRSIYAYLRTVEPVHNPVKTFTPPDHASL